MQVIKQSLFKARKRINFDSLVSFNGVDQYVDCGVNTNVVNTIDHDKNFSISCFLFIDQWQGNQSMPILSAMQEPSDNTTGWSLALDAINESQAVVTLFLSQYLIGGSSTKTSNFRFVINFRLGQIIHLLINHYDWNTPAELHVNGERYVVPQNISSNYQTNGSIYEQGIYSLYIGLVPRIRSYPDRWFNGGLNHITIFNRVLTRKEVISIHRKGGILLEEELLKACVAHYIGQPGAAKFWDVVEQYNAQKTYENLYTSYASNPGGWYNQSNGNPREADGSAVYIGSYPVGLETCKDVDLVVDNNSFYTYTFNLGTTNVEFEVIITDRNTSTVLHTETSIGDTSKSNNRKTYQFDFYATKQIKITFKVDAISVGVSAKMYWDKLEENIVQPYHGTFINYNPIELGLESFQNQSAWKDLYTKQLKNHLVQHVRAHYSNNSWLTFNSANTSYFRFYIDDRNFTTNSTFHILFLPAWGWLKRQKYSSGRILRFYYRKLSDGSTTNSDYLIYENGWQELFVKFENNELYITLYSQFLHVQTLTITDVDIYVQNLINVNNDFTAPDSYTYLNKLAVYNRILTDSEISEVRKDNDPSGADAIYHFGTINPASEVLIKDLSGNSWDLLFEEEEHMVHPTLSPTFQGCFVEASTLLPALQNALKATGSQYVRAVNVIPTKAPTTNTREVTLMTAIFIPEGEYDLQVYNIACTSEEPRRDNHIVGLSYQGGVQQIDFDGANQGSSSRYKAYNLPIISPGWHSLVVQYIPNSSFAVQEVRIYVDGVRLVHDFSLHEYWYVINASFTIDPKRPGFYTTYMAVFERITTELEILQVANNTLLANPVDKTDLLAFWNFNAIIDDTAVSGNYLIKDLSGNGNDAVLTNYTAIDAEYARKEIEVIRQPNTIHFGKALRLDRAYTAFIRSQNPLYYGRHFQFWFYPLAQEDQVLISNSLGGINYFIALRSDGQFEIAGNVASTSGKLQAQVTHAIPYKVKAWNFIHMALRQSAPYYIKLFVNGVSYNIPEIRWGGAEFQDIGRSFSPYQNFNGFIAKLAYNGMQNSDCHPEDLIKEYHGYALYNYDVYNPGHGAIFRLPDENEDIPNSLDLGHGFSLYTGNAEATRRHLIFQKGRRLVSYE